MTLRDTSTASERHVSRDRTSRPLKAAKIARVLSSRAELAGARVLDIGTGIGLIAEHFQQIVGPGGKVAAVDRVNEFRGSPPIDFRQVEGNELPFADESFDVVISNHVMEHVGPQEDQLQHLSEIKRVLTDDGIVYLAVPNRWAPLEPHFKLPFLSWLPMAMRSGYVRLAGRGAGYDCYPPSRGNLVKMLAESGMQGTDVTLEVLRIFARGEMRSALSNAIAWCPDPVLRLTMGLIPTLIFLVRKRASTP